MHADRYQPQKADGRSLSLSVSIVGGLIAAAMLGNTVVEVIERDKPLITYTVPPPPPPPVPEVKPKVEVKTAPQRVDQPITTVPTKVEEPFMVQPDPGPPVTLGTGDGLGSGAGTVMVEPPKPAPAVLTEAGVDPRYLRDFQPVYPAEERRAGNEGVVTVRVLIGVDGRVREVQRVASPSEAFWRVTEQRALGKWRFKPATRDGVPYESWRTMTVRFRMEE
ncbi:energy transducer TonB [Sphingomonas sp.]|jgi:protein TonB|uniref:energy transducer TonB n=1 Tax=Sphingomonas sp. TaxID=28214 RepID=UPI002D7FA4AD|nr:energy transducer TonB [Sphingomonas sp.]HEU0045437.1 energy transducer TonB [Sphingomonas sp.]